MVLAVPLPEISVSLAPPDEPFAEPYSPFSTTNITFHDDDDSFRPKHLTPPPAHMKFHTLVPSPLRPQENPGKGMERERFEALLKSSRERNTGGLKKGSDLRKEIALKVHKNKQAERRALFLSKVLAPPSPSATLLPKTPPESPAIFHYSLPSPGLVSPLALFESLNDASSGPLTYAREPWVEQVDFRLPTQPKADIVVIEPRRSNKEAKSSRRFPSLDQITARLGQSHSRTPSPENENDGKRTLRLPSFLVQSRSSEAERPRLSLGVGRLQMPIQSPKPSKQEHAAILPPKSPRSPLPPQIQITTTVVPRSSSSSPTELSVSNVNALNMRERRAANMLSTLKRRVAPSEAGINGHDHEDPDERRWRRHSAPAEMVARPRAGFEHPVLKLPGGF